MLTVRLVSVNHGASQDSDVGMDAVCLHESLVFPAGSGRTVS